MARNFMNNAGGGGRASLTPLFTLAGVFGMFAAAGAFSVAGAQIRPLPLTSNRRAADTIPSEYKPPAGMCRVWLDGVPAAQQPAPTDCPSATQKKPANARVIYGEDPRNKGAKPSDKTPGKGLGLPIKKSPVDMAIPQNDNPSRIRPPGDRSDDKRISDEQLFGDRNGANAGTYPGTYRGTYPGGFLPGQGANGVGIPGGVGTGTGILGDPRYFNNGAGVRPPGTGSGVCLDRDQDGWCDDLRFGPPVCLDQDKDGRCDDLPEFASQAYPQTLPHMRSALDVVEGRGSAEVARWLGTNEFTVRLPDAASGSTPWRAIFLDARNELLQVWTDRNRDGLAERVEIFRNGQRTKLIQR